MHTVQYSRLQFNTSGYQAPVSYPNCFYRMQTASTHLRNHTVLPSVILDTKVEENRLYS